MLLFLAGLQSIDPTLYEAARLDGAGKWARFRHITLPALLPIIGASTIFALIGAYVRSFDVVWVLTRAGFDTEVIATFIYREAFTYGRFDKAIAAGLILTIFLSAIFLITRLIKPKGGQNE
jgi:ABC-type sugar transport system permease subunit